LSTKIHALADTLCRPVGVMLTTGQAADNPMLKPLLDRHRRTGHRRPWRLVADKAYSHPSTRRLLRRRRIRHDIPERRDQRERRKAKGRAGGRPPRFDTEIYAQRNTVERCFNRLKQWRGIATRYDKYAITYLGGVTLAMIITSHRTGLRDTP
jgi:transposase